MTAVWNQVICWINTFAQIVLRCLGTGTRARAEAPGAVVTLEQLCNNDKTSLTRISQARRLIEQIRTSSCESCARFTESFIRLETILTTVKSGKICNLDLVNQVRHYHLDFIATNGSANGSAEKRKQVIGVRILEALRQFFISFCFQISAECKMALINNLEYDTKGVITDEDYELIKFLENFGATLLNNESKLTDFDDIILFSEFAALSEMKTQFGDTKILVKMKTNKFIKELIEVREQV